MLKILLILWLFPYVAIDLSAFQHFYRLRTMSRVCFFLSFPWSISNSSMTAGITVRRQGYYVHDIPGKQKYKNSCYFQFYFFFICCVSFFLFFYPQGKKKKKKKGNLFISLCGATRTRRWRHQPVTNLGNELIAVYVLFHLFSSVCFIRRKRGVSNWKPVATSTRRQRHSPFQLCVLLRAEIPGRRQSETPERVSDPLLLLFFIRSHKLELFSFFRLHFDCCPPRCHSIFFLLFSLIFLEFFFSRVPLRPSQRILIFFFRRKQFFFFSYCCRVYYGNKYAYV